MQKKEIIKKWYDILCLPEKYKYEFENALSEIELPDDLRIETYDFDEKCGKKNLLSFLYMCEDLERRYKEKGISDDILYDTLQDIKMWLDIWSEIKGELYLGEIGWLKKHLGMKLFKLGRLQFCMGKAEKSIPEMNITNGDNVIEVHIPAVGPLKQQECEESFKLAKDFFEKFYPDFKYKYFTCHSWLLDSTLKELLPSESNIIKFQNMYEIVHKEKSDSILKYVFKWNTARDNLYKFEPTSDFAKKVKEHATSGKYFYEALGVIDKIIL